MRREQAEDKTAGVSTLQSATSYEIIDSVELAKRWVLPTSWIREQARSRATDPIPTSVSVGMCVFAGAAPN